MVMDIAPIYIPSKPKKIRDAETGIPSKAACTFEASYAYAQKVMKVTLTLQNFFLQAEIINDGSSKARRGEFDVAAKLIAQDGQWPHRRQIV